MTRAHTLFAALLPLLQTITVANGYTSNAGNRAVLGPVPRRDNEAYPYLRLIDGETATESHVPHRPVAKLRADFMVEGYAEQADPVAVYGTGHDVIGDIKKAVFGDPTADLGGGAIDLRLEGYRVLAPEDGSTVVLAQVRGSYSFNDKFSAP